MKKIINHYYSLLILLSLYAPALAQSKTSISGTITDATTNEPLIGVNIMVKGKVIGTVSNYEGKFNLETNERPPFILVVSMVGYQPQEVAITEINATGLQVQLSEQTMLGQEVVVSASRYQENILQSPVTIEKLDLIGIQQAAAPDFYDALAHVKGVQVMSGSLNFSALNTRGFASIANTRFVQLIDGMDNSAPLLNFPTGNLVGISELDIESVELVPGAASALYGPNAFNGILLMNSKSPFEYQGLSAQAKVGLTSSQAGGTHPLYSFSVRYAQAFNDKLAFKVNFSFMDATDWVGNDYKTERTYADSEYDLSGQPNFDGMNLYGDETPIPIPLGAPFGTLDIRRTGIMEEDLVDDYSARSIKGDLALHYRLTDGLEAIYNYRYGGGNSIYHGNEKYALRNFNQQFHKLELKADHYFVRLYHSIADAGDSYNLSALGAFTNERFSDTRNQWAPTYGQSYVLATQGYIPGVPGGNAEAAHAFARSQADAVIPARGSDAYNQVIDAVRNDYFQRNPPGAKFKDNSKLYHGEVNYNFKEIEDVIEIMVGGNVRRYDLFSDGTIFNEDPVAGDSFERITIDEFGVYTQLAKNFSDRLKLSGSIRYDKNENFDGQVTPRLSAVYSATKLHNFRASFQTGFRNPDTQAQFIYFPAGSGILLGGTKANAERYGIHHGGAENSLGETVYLDFLKPERLTAYEVGYKGVINEKVLVDVNYYYNNYKDFISSQTVFAKEATVHQGNPLPAGTAFRPYTNAKEKVTSQGIGLGLTYNLPSNFVLSGNYNYASFNADEEEGSEFEPQFNTPEHRYSISIGNRKLTSALGFNIAWRWQDEFLWQSGFSTATIPAFGALDAQVSYKLDALKSILKVGGTNILRNDYRTNAGAGFVGAQYYVSITFDQFLN